MELFWFVVVESSRVIEAVPQRARDKPSTSGRTNEGESRHRQPHRAGGRTLAEDQVELKVLHCGIEHFFDGASQAMDLVDKQDVAVFEFREDRREVATFFERWTRRDVDLRVHLVRDDARQRGLSKSRRAGEQQVPHRLVAGLCRLHHDSEMTLELFLAYEVVEALGAQAELIAVLDGSFL